MVGRVFDSETGVSLEGVTVSVSGPASEPGATPPEAVRVTDAEGAFDFPTLLPGRYDIRFVKPGYRESNMTDFVVMAGQPNRVDFPLPPLASAAAEAMPDVEEFVVVASPVAEILSASRLDSDQLLNTLSAEDFSKLAVSDVADALKFVPGVNVVEGQFAVIRGLEDRYSSTLFNSAPVPSPDPDRQSVQLDLFPSDVVSDLAVAKTFGPELPSNSSGGSINILTGQYPEEFEFKLGAGTGFNSNAWGDFLQFEDGSSVGNATDGHDTLEQDYAASLGGRGSVYEREIRFKAAVGRETDYTTREGFQETLEPALAVTRQFPRPPTVVQSGDLTLGQLGLSGGRFDLTESDYEDQLTGYAGLGIDLDEAGNHKLDSSFFYTEKHGEAVVATDDGYLPGFDYGTLAAKQADGQEINPNTDFECCATLTSWIRAVRGSANDAASRGPLWFSSFSTSESFETDRDLFLSQLNGDHHFDAIEGLHVSWATNYAETTQNETSRGLRYFFEPDDVNQAPTKFPVRPEDLGLGQFAANANIFLNKNDITEDQGFGRLDADYEVPVNDALDVTFSSGAWYEDASRHVDSSFLESPTVEGLSQFVIFADTPEELGKSVYEEIAPAPEGLRDSKNQSSREIEAWYLGSKSTLYEQFDLLAGFRLENIFIESLNDPFTGELALDGSPAIFPTKYLFFDRLDNPARNEVSTPPPPGTTFNDQLLGIDVPVDPATGLVDLVDQAQIDSFVNGRIDETKFLPALGFSYRPIEGLAIRGAWSETVARPSFREMGFYVSVEPATDDLLVGNPQLGLSEVESYDTRAEYVFGEHGDIAALSLFYKTIQDPIESIVVRNPLNFDGSSSALFRTFFNNENEATVRGIEVEARKSLDFFGPEFLQYISLGGSYTYIDAEVDRSEIEIQRAAGFFGKAPGALERFSGLAGSRRLFGQPEWIMNADISFDQPDWGTKATLVLFGISDVLDAAGSSVISPNGSVISFTPDRYVDSFYQLDLILSQTWRVDFLRGDLTFKLSAKNLTNSTRQIIYDKDQTVGEIAERSWKIGRDFKLSLVYSF